MSLRTQIAANLRVYARTRINEAHADTQQRSPGLACTRCLCFPLSYAAL